MQTKEKPIPDKERFDKFLTRYTPLMRYIIAPILQNEQDREECLSDVALRVWQNLHKFDPGKGSFTTWLTVITRNTALSHRDRLPPQTEPLNEWLVSDDTNPETLLLRKERQAELQRALRHLRDSEAVLFFRKYYYCQSTAQIAAELGTTERSIEGKLYRIRKKLQKYLKGDRL